MDKKSILLISLLSMMGMAIFNGCSSSSNGSDNPVSSDTLIVNNVINSKGIQEFELKGTNTIKKGTYFLKGWCYIPSGSTLTIEPGTIIKGDKDTKAALIVEPGGKLYAQGTKDAPIVFTSAQSVGNRKPGDWGGVIVCGKARNNQGTMQIEGGPRTVHGGNDDADNSGIISYVRIEFAGYPFKTDQEINGLTFGSVGSGTQVDHVQVSYSNDDSYEWFGGSVNCKYLVAYHGWDDEFDTDDGFSGHCQFLLGVRNPKIADQSLSNGFESDNNASGSSQSPYTTAVFSNVTFVGPIGQSADFANTSDYINGGSLYPNNGSRTGVFQAAMQIRRNSKLSCFNTVAMGYPCGLLLDVDKGDPNSLTFAKNGDLKLQHIVFAQMGAIGSDVNSKKFPGKDVESDNGQESGWNGSNVSNSHTFFLLAANKNSYYNNISDLKLSQPNSLLSSPNYGPMTGSPLLNAAEFTDTLLNNSFFTKVSYIGAFASNNSADDWMSGWTNFDPQNTRY
jgi:hypothetical protein